MRGRGGMRKGSASVGRRKGTATRRARVFETHLGVQLLAEKDVSHQASDVRRSIPHGRVSLLDGRDLLLEPVLERLEDL